MREKLCTCVFCDGGCALRAADEDGQLRVRPADPGFPALCSKAHLIDEYRLHPDRITHPLRRVGERGSGRWERVSWEVALGEIAVKLRQVIDTWGPEALAVSEMPLNHGFGGITRRLMNGLGSPNYITALQLCMGNTAQVHRAVYGGFTLANWDVADCVVYFGQDRSPEKWPAEHLRLRAALGRGAKLVVVDPRETDTARLADFHLRIRYGTDAALALAWIHVIIAEGLFDERFVEERCEGFAALVDRVRPWTPERAADVCGVDAALIRETARVYASARAAVIPWGATADMQVNSTALLQAQCILRAICGFVGVSETLPALAHGGVTNSELAAFELISPGQRAKQLGADAHPLLTFAASARYAGVRERLGVPYEPDLMAMSCAADAASVFRAMRTGDPYPVRAFISAANNTVMSYANQQGIVEALLAQELVVVFEHWMTPTAQLADYVLPGDMWAERDVLGKPFDVAPVLTASSALRVPAGECRSWYFVVSELARRLGAGALFPWKDERELYDWRLAPLGLTFAELEERGSCPNGTLPARGGFATPTGKVELASSVLRDLGFDPLPNYAEPRNLGAEAAEAAVPAGESAAAAGGRAADDAFADEAAAGQRAGRLYPYVIFAGLREAANYNTNLRQMPGLRVREPEPCVLVNPADVAREGLAAGAWCAVETAYGCVELMVRPDEAQPAGTLRVPHGWWKPECAPGLAGGLSAANLHGDGLLFPDDAWNVDAAQGLPNLRGGIRARILPLG
ncbi:molybdopterin-dependent oxidoreductase [Adlercreutzia sp. ZJ242]|uniref:molybdopterin-containing oxidoreductase family protein n=1 Tax=Adlercreutzia sp. ZJ242 TaxID=2709409 RepID=UPI0013E9EAB9|nr:molybdopterin-dependent oxidoreductase [Adlercreutzia sp. ZJ242]